MSKSLNNFITLKETLDALESTHGKGRGAEVLRFYYAQTHYRSKIDFSRKGLEEAGVALRRLEETRARLKEAAAKPASPSNAIHATAAFVRAFEDAMDDDIHTPQAIAALFDFQRVLNGALEQGRLVGPDAAHALEALERCGHVLTLFSQPVKVISQPEVDLSWQDDDGNVFLMEVKQFLNEAGIDEAQRQLEEYVRGIAAANPGERFVPILLAIRRDMRAAKNWRAGDAVRDAAKAAGYLIEDKKDGTQSWRKA